MRNIGRLYRYIMRYWGLLLAAIFFMIGFAAFSSISLVMAIPLFDYVFKSDSSAVTIHTFHDFFAAMDSLASRALDAITSLPALFEESTYEPLQVAAKDILTHTAPSVLLWVISVTVIVLILLKNIFFFCEKVLFANLRGLSAKDIRNDMFHKYLFQSLAFFSKSKVGDSLVRIVSDVRIVNNFFIKSFSLILQNIVLLLMYAYVALALNARLFLYSLILFPVFTLFLSFLGRKIKKYAKRLQHQSSNMFSNIEETINNLRIVKAFAREDHEMIRFNKVNMANYRSWRKGQIYKALNVPISELNGTVMGIIVLLIGGNQIISGHSNFTLGEFTSFLLAIFSMLHPIKKLSDAYTDVRKAMVSLDRVSVILDRKSEIAEHPDQKSKTDFSSSIELRDVEFSYSPDKPVLKSVSFTINKGEKVALVGSSGSGKTTIANLLTRMYDAQKGSICLDGIPINSIKLKDLRTLFGTVTQESILFSDTIANNIRYGSLREVSDEEIREAARIAYIDDFVETLPHQYHQMLQPKASNLSGGQKQRICIARAIVGNPPILIFDEATSALDTEAERNVQLAIDQATRNRTVVVIAHRLSTILSSDKIVVMDEGEIVGIGPHEELLKNCPRYQVLYNLQFNG